MDATILGTLVFYLVLFVSKLFGFSLLDFMWISFSFSFFFLFERPGDICWCWTLFLLFFDIYLPFWGALHRHLVEKGYPQHSVVPVVAPCQ